MKGREECKEIDRLPMVEREAVIFPAAEGALPKPVICKALPGAEGLLILHPVCGRSVGAEIFCCL